MSEEPADCLDHRILSPKGARFYSPGRSAAQAWDLGATIAVFQRPNGLRQTHITHRRMAEPTNPRCGTIAAPLIQRSRFAVCRELGGATRTNRQPAKNAALRM